MRIILETKIKQIELPSSGGEFYLEEPYAMLSFLPGKNEDFTLQMNNHPIELPLGTTRVRIELNEEFVCHAVIHLSEQSVIGYVFRFSGPSSIDKEIIDNLINLTSSLQAINEDCSFSVDELIQAQGDNLISLLCVLNPLTGYDNDELQQKLKDDLSQKVRSICSRPKRGTRREELVQDVGLVKEITTNTLTHLAAHTEHWKARTLTSLVPKRLLSTIIEDDLDIYENLFFRMAIDDISEYVNQQIIRLVSAQRQKQKENDLGKYAEKVNDWRRKKLFSELSPKGNLDAADTLAWQYKEALDTWKDIAHLLLTIRNSSFYQQINRHKRISRNVYLTNILKNDQRYKALYDLWVAIRRERKNNVQGVIRDTGDAHNDRPEVYYSNYTFVLLVWCMQKKLGLRFADEQRISFNGDQLKSCVLRAEDDVFDYRLSLTYDPFGQPEIDLEYIERNYSKTNVPSECVPYLYRSISDFSSFMSFDGKSISFYRKPSIDESNKLRALVKGNKKIADLWTGFISKLFNTNVIRDMRSYHDTFYPVVYPIKDEEAYVQALESYLDNGTSHASWFVLADTDQLNKTEHMASSLINYGDIPISSEWEPYSGSRLPIDQTDIFSAQRIMKVITMRRAILLMDWEKDKSVHCPVCLAKTIRKVDQHTMECDCGSQWGETRCVAEGGCGKYFKWIAPKEDSLKQLSEDDVTEKSQIKRILKRDMVFGANIITDFEYEFRENNGRVNSIKLYPVCPHCGTKRFTKINSQELTELAK